jgi:8-oxo-dGTP diphosphatase
MPVQAVLLSAGCPPVLSSRPESRSIVKFSEIDWSTWVPRETATLMFVRMDGMVLLIRKLMGMGAGLINAPGGRVDPGETPEQGAVREAQEELHVTPIGVKEAGVLAFEFTDGYSLRCHVYTASSYEGVPTQTDEAIPLWIDEREMPYSQMWADDRLWYPLVLQGRKFSGRFLFDESIMLGCELDVEPFSDEAAGAQPRN